MSTSHEIMSFIWNKRYLNTLKKIGNKYDKVSILELFFFILKNRKYLNKNKEKLLFFRFSIEKKILILFVFMYIYKYILLYIYEYIFMNHIFDYKLCKKFS